MSLRPEDLWKLAYVPTPPVGEILDITPPPEWDQELSPAQQVEVDLRAEFAPAIKFIEDDFVPVIKEVFGNIARGINVIGNGIDVRKFQRILWTSARQSGRTEIRTELQGIYDEHLAWEESLKRKQGTHMIKSAKPGIMLPERQRCSGPYSEPFKHRGKKR